MIVQAIPRYSAKPVKLEIVNGRMKTAVGMTTNRLLKPRQFFFKKPFVNASTSPAVKNAKVLSRKILDWIGFWNTGLPKIVPLPMNSRMIARRIPKRRRSQKTVRHIHFLYCRTVHAGHIKVRRSSSSAMCRQTVKDQDRQNRSDMRRHRKHRKQSRHRV